jgi:anti-sigma factor RsiW
MARVSRKSQPALTAAEVPTPMSSPKNRCLDPDTLASLAAGRVPAERLLEVRSHLPHCPRCLNVVASAALQRTGRSGSLPRGGDTVELPRWLPLRPSSTRTMSAIISVVALAGIGAWCWFAAHAEHTDPVTEPREQTPNLPVATPEKASDAPSLAVLDAGMTSMPSAVDAITAPAAPSEGGRRLREASLNRAPRRPSPSPTAASPRAPQGLILDGRHIRTSLDSGP